MAKQYLVVFLFAMCTALASKAQDTQFTQFYASPLTLNPALTGAFEGTFRASAIYRDQWRGVLDHPYSTFATSLDMRFNASSNPQYKDAFGVGILFYTDNVRSLDFRTNQLGLYGAYHKALDVDNTQFLSVGLQLAFSQRNLNYEDINFGDQFNGTDGYTLPSAEVLPANNFSYFDLGTGLHYTFAPNDNLTLYLGASMYHFNKPNVSFYDEKVKLDAKYSGQIGAVFNISESTKLLPRFIYTLQGSHQVMNVGANFRTLVNDYSGIALHLGGWARPVSSDDSGYALESVVLLAGIEYQSVLFGLSYDANLHHIKNFNRVQGAFEISVAYLGEYENETILCPTF